MNTLLILLLFYFLFIFIVSTHSGRSRVEPTTALLLSLIFS